MTNVSTVLIHTHTFLQKIHFIISSHVYQLDNTGDILACHNKCINYFYFEILCVLTSYGPSLHNYQGMCLILLTIHQQMEFCTEVSWPCLFLCGTRIVTIVQSVAEGKTDVPAFSCMSIERFKHTTYDQDICDAKVKVAASFRSHVIKLLTMTMPKLTAGFQKQSGHRPTLETTAYPQRSSLHLTSSAQVKTRQHMRLTGDS